MTTTEMPESTTTLSPRSPRQKLFKRNNPRVLKKLMMRARKIARFLRKEINEARDVDRKLRM